MQNPNEGKGVNEEKENAPLREATENNVIDIHKEHLFVWLKKNKSFLNKFIKKLNEYKLINYSEKDVNFKTRLLEDFLFTDVVKCRSRTENLNDHHIKTCGTTYLKNELEKFGKNKLIFVFSSRSWEFIHENYLNDEPSYKDNNKISQEHGKLFFSKTMNSCFIPLAHFSQREFNNYLRNSYFDYLEEGLKNYSSRDLKIQ